ncbi:tetratricopeptide repeat protein 22 isoform X1 [Chiloscyllium plagiosum]|uniref:tetratricopeptide repeat protein 22 isoform X1 n=1 Tax=Chiloscyllium plagiosum TaxID=36176 RepID=UPI001CB82EF3|nr:tetratricopeptide repeat protein 22 isoform X1 [Chiloscyllium plagiosum]
MGEDTERDIEEIIQEMDYIPGHFHLELNLNFEPLQPERLRRRDAKLKRESLQLEAEDGAQRFAVRNLLGVFAFYLEEYPAAEEIFSSVCQEEPGNLNAWANLGYVYDRLQKEGQAAECLERLSQLMAGEEGGEAESLSPLRAARCLAEQAYASAFDVGLQSEEEHATKLSTAIKLYDKALRYGKNMITSEEKRSWYFTMAIMYIRLDGMLMNKDPYASKRLLFLNRSLVLLREVLKSDSAQYKALAWCYLGMMLERMDIFPDTPMAVHDCGFSGADPLDCYGQAIEMAKTDPFILNRLAKVFHFLGKQDMATGICNMALNILPDPGTNWQAYSTRAKINMKIYTQGLERVKMGHSGVPDRQLLTKAKADLDLILSVCPCLKTYLDMGQVCYYMGVDAVQELQLVDENALNNALVFFAKAMELDMGDTLPEIQLLRGKCLQVKGEEHNAVECFKQAIELDDVGSQYSETFRCLIESLLSLFIQEKSSEEMVIREVEIWVEKAEAKYQMERVRQELRLICRNHMPKILKLSRAMIIAGKLRIVKLLLETMNPDHT